MHPEEMDDYSALAQRISVSVHEVRGCLLLSRDGLVLGAFPEEEENLAKGAWLRFCALGEPDRSFVEFTDQVWAYVKRGPYAAFALADAGVRPGILVDQLEQMLMTADEGRSRRDTLRVPDAASAPSGKPRTSLHPPAPKADPIEVVAVESAPLTAAESATAGPWKHHASAEQPPAAGGAGSAAEATAPQPVVAATPTPPPPAPEAAPAQPAETPDVPPTEGAPTPVEEAVGSALGKEPKKLVGGAGGPEEEETEVDRVLLAKEFSGLLQVDLGDDEVSS
jgi:hypothetical protein